MALYRRPESIFWYYEFRIANRRYRGSTRSTNKANAADYEAAQRVKVASALLRTPTGAEVLSPTPLELVIKGRRSWGKLSSRFNLGVQDRTAQGRRQLWRDVGIALHLGRATRPTDSDFLDWCKCAEFDMNGTTRDAAMWLAEHWETAEHFAPHIWSPVVLHRISKAQEMHRRRITELSDNGFVIRKEQKRDVNNQRYARCVLA